MSNLAGPGWPLQTWWTGNLGGFHTKRWSGRHMDWKQVLTSITSSVDGELRLRNAYPVTENRILRKQIQGRVRLTASERRELAVIGQQLGKKALAEIATVAKSDTIAESAGLAYQHLASGALQSQPAPARRSHWT